MRLVVHIKVPPPDPILYKFEGTLRTWRSKTIPLSSENFVLRESKLKNTEWIIGIVTYTGKDTKVTQSTESARQKVSKMEMIVQNSIVTVFVLQLIVSILLAVLYGYWIDSSYDLYRDYIFLSQDNAFFAGLLSVPQIFLLLSTMIPISLVITLELIKIV